MSENPFYALYDKYNELDGKYQHQKYYHEGYRECMLTLNYGEIHVGDNMDIDVKRYSPGSARDISYQSGWFDALNDYNLLSKNNK